MQLPKVREGWSWRITHPTICCSNPNCCGQDSAGHPKVYIELLLHQDVRRYGTIDVEFYGDGRSVIERAQGMLDSVVAEQMHHCRQDIRL